MRVAAHPLRRRAAVTAALAAALLVPASTVAAAPADQAGAERGRPDAAGSGTLPLRGLDLDALTIPELQDRMDAGTLTAQQLTQAYLDRIDDLNDDLGAVLSVNPEALADAAASDQARKRHQTRGPCSWRCRSLASAWASASGLTLSTAPSSSSTAAIRPR